MAALTPEQRAELYHQIFEVDKRGAALLEDLVVRFSLPAVTDGGIDAVIKTYHRMGQNSVVQFIVGQINRANGVNDSPTTEIPPMKFGARHVYMDDLAGAAGGGGAADPGAAATSGGAPAASGQPGAAASTGAPAGGAGDQSGSALSGGAEWSLQSIPEKFQVKGDDGEIDVTATIRKVDEHRASLEKRLGGGGIRPKTPDEYKLPESDAFKHLTLDDAAAKAFKEKAHGMGLSQQQYEGIMSEWATLAPQLVNAGQAETVDSAVSALKEVWKGDYDANIKESFRVVSKMADAAGIPFDEVEKAIGNNPTAIRLFAALAPEMREDATPAAAAGATGGSGQSSNDYMAENWAAYSDTKHPQHKAVTTRYNAIVARETRGATS